MKILHEFYLRERCQCKATVMTLVVNLNSAEIKFVSRICERGVYEPVPEFQECMECLQVISR